MGDPDQLEDAIPSPGTVVGDKYRVDGVIARGGMGVVLRGRHLLLEHDVAIKFVLDRAGATAKRRLLREARAMRALTSEHVASVLDLGMFEDAPFIVMELLEGRDLRHRVDQDGPLPIDEAVDCLLEASVAVAEAHAVGIVHRDLKPANLFLTRTRQKELVKVLDFGISKIPEPSRDDLHATTEDTMLGTPYFMSPEQLRNPAAIDHRSDLWSLGVTLFYLLTAELPFVGENRREITAAIFADEPLSLLALRSDAPAELAEVVLAALAKRPDDRIRTVAALAERLLPFASKRGVSAAETIFAGVDASSGTGESTETRSPNDEADKRSSRAARSGLGSQENTAPLSTESGLSSTLWTHRDSDPSNLGPTAPRPTSGRPIRWRPIAMGIVGVAAIVVLGPYLAPSTDTDTDADEPPPAAAPRSAEPPPTADASAPKAGPDLHEKPTELTAQSPKASASSSAPSSPAAPPKHAGATTPAAQPTSSAPAKPASTTSPAVPTASTPAGVTPASPEPANPEELANPAEPPPLDIDGLPIIQ